MDDKTNAESGAPEERAPANPTRAAPPLSAEVTTAVDPSPSAVGTVVRQAPAGEAEQPPPVRDESLSFLQPGTRPGSLGRLGHYEVLELLGKGAFGTVFKAFDDRLERLVAIKVLNPQFARNATARSRFVREARSAAAVNCKYVISTYEVSEQPIPYLVMEYVVGKTLRDRIKQPEPLSVRDILQIGAEIAEGLAAAHARGLIHRDIKPANILLETVGQAFQPAGHSADRNVCPTDAPLVGQAFLPAGASADRNVCPTLRVKIADFGLARAVDDSSLTQSGVIAGTPMFMSPEQARGETLDHRTDLFSLGSVLYMMATGQPPFRAPRTLAVLKRVCDDTPQPIREVNPAIPDSLAAVVNMLLVKDPGGRFQTAAAVAELLRQHLAHLDDPATPLPAGIPVEGETPAPLPSGPAPVNAAPSPIKKRRAGWKWAAVLLLPLLALALTETAGLTHWFQGGPATEGPSKPESEGSLLQGNPEPEKPGENEAPPAVAASEDNPFSNATVGDWAEYKVTQTGDGPQFDRKLRMEVTGRTEKVRMRTITTFFGQAIASPEQEIDLTRPYDPGALFSGADARTEKVDSGNENIAIGDKEYETSWTKLKVTAKPNNRELEDDVTYWISRSGPRFGLVRMEVTRRLKAGARTTESKMTMELTASGNKITPGVAQSSAARAEWKAAAGFYAQVFAGQPVNDGHVGFEYACVLVLVGDHEGYQKFCADLLEQSGKPNVRDYHVARACTLMPDSVKDPDLPGKLAAKELEEHKREVWSLTEQGGLAYRAGRYDDAASLLEQSLKADSRPSYAVLNWLWLAMVEHRRGKPDEARAWLEKATKWREQYPKIPLEEDHVTGMHLHNWLEAQVLHREAEALLVPKK